jgi:SAM-dependent methyltransferase
MTLRSVVNRLTASLRRARGGDVMARDRAASMTPLCAEFGYSRGTPIDRHYIEAFLEKHSADIRGRVLEIGDDTYSRRFGGDRIVKQDVLHIHAGHRKATIVGDLANQDVLPQRTFDCMILTQMLHLIFDMTTAVEQIRAALKPGGVALITVPGISPLDRGEWRASWYWSLTDLALARLLSGPFDRQKVTISTHGNLYAATAFLHGAAVEEVEAAKLAHLDRSYPVTIAARAVA